MRAAHMGSDRELQLVLHVGHHFKIFAVASHDAGAWARCAAP